MFFTYVNTPKNINDLFTVANTKNARKAQQLKRADLQSAIKSTIKVRLSQTHQINHTIFGIGVVREEVRFTCTTPAPA